MDYISIVLKNARYFLLYYLSRDSDVDPKYNQKSFQTYQLCVTQKANSCSICHQDYDYRKRVNHNLLHYLKSNKQATSSY